MKTADGANAEGFDLGKLVELMAGSHASLANGAAACVERYYRPAIFALQAEFQRALIDPETNMKSSLQVAITNVIALARASQSNDYANAMVRRDQVDPYRDRPDLDMDATSGARLKAGT